MTTPTPNDLPMPTPLSPAAQAVLDVYWKNVGVPSALAKELGFTNTPLVAAICAAADQIAPTKQNYSEASNVLAATCLSGMAYAANELRLIATELETNA